MNVLIADDEALYRALLGGMLRAEGHHVIEAADGAEALALLAGAAVDAVVSDILMPRLDGYRLCAEVRKDPRWRELPFILHSATHGAPADAKLGHALGADAFLPKPTDAPALRAALQTAVSRPARGRVSSSHEVAEVLAEYGGRLVDSLHQKNLELAARTRALEESEERLRLALDAAGLGTWDWNLTIDRIVWSGHYAQLLGLKPEEFDGSYASIERSVHPEDRQGICDAIGEAQKTRTDYFHEFRVVWPDGSVHWVASRGEFRYDAAGAPVRMLGALLDLTEHRQAETARRESEERFRQLAENIQEVFWMTDRAKEAMLYVSPAYEKIWGRTCASLYAAPRDWLEAIHPEDRDRVRQAVRSKQTRGEYVEEYRIVRPDGAVRWIRDRAFPVRDHTGAVFRVAGVAEDITERRELEEQLRRSQRVEAIGTLSSGIAHDLNNILTPVLVAAKMLRGSLPNPRDRELMDLVESSARRGAGVVRQLLTFSRGIAGQRISVQVRHLIKEMASIVRETFPRGITLVESTDPELWPVVADATQLHQVLLNLCVNARDAMPDGGVLTVEAKNVRLPARDSSLAARAPEGPYVLLTVRDTGPGIPHEILDRIFEPFFTTKAAGHGTGLGLSTVLGIVRSHGGVVSVDSGPARGAAFNVYLPAAPEGVAPATSHGGAEPGRGQGEMVLVVDDEATILAASRIYLERSGYRVLTAGDGHEALATFVAHQQEVKIVVTDMMMPGMSGMAFAQAVRALQSGVRLIATTGMVSESRRSQLTAIGVTDILQKPYEPRELIATLQRVLGLAVAGGERN